MSQAQNYLNGSTYEVDIDNVNFGAFTRIGGISIQVEDLPAKDDDGKHMVNTAGSTNAGDITMARRFNGDTSLYDWIAEVKQKGNLAPQRTGTIRVKNSEGKLVSTFEFSGAWAKGWYGPDFNKDSQGNNVLTESIVLSVSDVQLQKA